jgi:hypothetical protein
MHFAYSFFTMSWIERHYNKFQKTKCKSLTWDPQLIHWLAPTILGSFKWDLDVVDDETQAKVAKLRILASSNFLGLQRWIRTVYIRLIHKMTQLRGTGPQFCWNWWQKHKVRMARVHREKKEGTKLVFLM